MTIQDYLVDLSAGHDLSRQQAADFLGIILDDESLPDEQIVKALTLLTNKPVKAVEVSGFVDAMRARMIKLPNVAEAIDTCGTGGDKSGTFNISTASAIVLAAGGVKVAKHGNRAATSKCGSADVLEALSIPINLDTETAANQINANNFGFLFAPQYHPSLKRLAIVRKQLGFPTVFNLLGPLLNPAGVKRQVIGTFSLDNAKLLAEVMSGMDYERAIVLTSQDGLDEASLAAPVNIFEVTGSAVKTYIISAREFGIEQADKSLLQGGDAHTNAKIITDLLEPAPELSPQQSIVVFNAGIGFYVAGQVKSIADGIKMAVTILSDGLGSAKLKAMSHET